MGNGTDDGTLFLGGNGPSSSFLIIQQGMPVVPTLKGDSAAPIWHDSLLLAEQGLPGGDYNHRLVLERDVHDSLV
jgi:hypothetical protein